MCLSSFLAVKGFSSIREALKVDVMGPEKNTVCRRVRASFSPEILQAVAVKGLSLMVVVDVVVVGVAVVMVVV